MAQAQFRHLVPGGAVWMRLDSETSRIFAPLPYLPHRDVSRFDVTPTSVGVEQRIGQPILLQPVLETVKQQWLGGKPQRQGFVLFETVRYQLGKANGLEQACGHPSCKALAAGRYQGQSCPQGITGGCVRVIRQRIQEQVCEAMAG